MSSNTKAELTVIIVSYNTKELTLKCLETLFENTKKTNFKAVVFDNASADGSADAIEKQYPQVELIRSNENLGFAKANNIVADKADTEWLLLLNPDTEVHDSAIDNLLDFSRNHPEAGITGGRTVFPDGSLNVASCWMRVTMWSMLCHAFGLTSAFSNTTFFNTEAIGGWRRDSVRKVDIISGCFLMTSQKLWTQLNGFDLKYVMYGEEADLCLRAIELGYSPMVTPNAQIMHLVGASTNKRLDKTALILKAKVTLIKDHWPQFLSPIGVMLMWLYVFTRHTMHSITEALLGKSKTLPKSKYWKALWERRNEWLGGYS